MWLFFPLKIWWLLLLSFPQKTAFVQFALVFIVTTLPKFATKKTRVQAVTRLMYTKNKTKQWTVFSAMPDEQKCHSHVNWNLELLLQKVFSVWGKARSMEAYVQCWVGTYFVKYAGSNSDLQEPNWNWVWFSKLKLELNQIFSKITGPFMCGIGTRIKIQVFEKRSDLNQRLIEGWSTETINSVLGYWELDWNWFWNFSRFHSWDETPFNPFSWSFTWCFFALIYPPLLFFSSSSFLFSSSFSSFTDNYHHQPCKLFNLLLLCVLL